jgi:predicted dehydrogenase
MTSTLSPPSAKKTIRLGFAGVGWIGLNRMQAALENGAAEASAIFDPSPESVAAAQEKAPETIVAPTFEALLDEELDAIVIATPSALHASQAIAALERGLAVFCQKPLARTRAETEAVLNAARSADRLLMTDLSYRYIRGVDRMRELIRSGELGTVFSADLTFHNAYGPNKPWFFDYTQSGGGCLIDLGTHLVDLASHVLGPMPVDRIESQLFRQGRRLATPVTEVEDFATASWDYEHGPTVRIACSWNLAAGREAVIEAVFYGTQGAVALKNENGSFFDFAVERYSGTNRELLAEPDRGWNWGGGAIRDFTQRLTANAGYDDACESLISVATILDRSYGR